MNFFKNKVIFKNRKIIKFYYYSNKVNESLSNLIFDMLMPCYTCLYICSTKLFSKTRGQKCLG